MLVKAYGSTLRGVDALTITVEVSVSPGVGYTMVGLPDAAVRESYYRIETAFTVAGLQMPRQKIIVNLSPAHLKKEGSSYDLPIAMGILAASGQVEPDKLAEYVIMGELNLDGSIQLIKGALPVAIQARKEKFRGFILPKGCAMEAAIVNDLEVYGVSTLMDVVRFFTGEEQPERFEIDTRAYFAQKAQDFELDFADVKGQEQIKRALEIAAAGGHNVILIGPPGAGKTMLAKRLPGILPPLILHEALDTTKIHSVAGKLGSNGSILTQRPFRNPHHTMSDVAMVGGGANPQPGEISLAHNGVLFLDELPEFKRGVLEVMRQPLEERTVSISRAKMSVEYPASFMLVASMNPCPCGYYNHPEKDCSCPPGAVQKYLAKISGPLLDRIDLHVEVTPVSFNELTGEGKSEPSSAVRERVCTARNVQKERYKEMTGVHCNAQMSSNQLKEICRISDDSKQLLKTAMEKLNLSARAYDRILKVGRTIADLAGSEHIQTEHIAEAIQYRSLDREMWG